MAARSPPGGQEVVRSRPGVGQELARGWLGDQESAWKPGGHELAWKPGVNQGVRSWSGGGQEAGSLSGVCQEWIHVNVTCCTGLHYTRLQADEPYAWRAGMHRVAG